MYVADSFYIIIEQDEFSVLNDRIMVFLMLHHKIYRKRVKGFIEHSMRLYEEPFRIVSNSTKTVEVRLNDEKRQAVQIGDFIEFTNLATGEQVKVKVDNVKVYDSFQALLQHYSNKEVGFSDEIQLSQKLASIYQIYNQTDELHLGALAIEIHLVP